MPSAFDRIIAGPCTTRDETDGTQFTRRSVVLRVFVTSPVRRYIYSIELFATRNYSYTVKAVEILSLPPSMGLADHTRALCVYDAIYS